MTLRSLPLALALAAVAQAAPAQSPPGRRAADSFAPAKPAGERPADGATAVVVEVALVETAKVAGGGDAPARPDLTGPADEVAARLAEVARSGEVRRVRLACSEGREATYSAKSQQPLVMSQAVRAGGEAGGRNAFAQRSVNYVDVGTTVTVTAWAGSDGSVTLDLAVTDARVRPAATEGDAAAIESSALATRLRVPAGRAVAAQELWTDGKGGRGATAVVVTARLVAAEPTAGK